MEESTLGEQKRVVDVGIKLAISKLKSTFKFHALQIHDSLTNALDQPADIVIVPRHGSERSHYSLMLVDRKLRKIHLMDSLSYKGQQAIKKLRWRLCNRKIV
ncbi:uncharacterized protein [Watersipora subatra]|uniref:uncharacterized protein isoform X2 n=1 Tax=Watersipora subatra TaxID=2589382 RepID=UPI00355ADC12